jgi:fructoselysine-6-P-deglycase FrlB-like protein
MARPYASEMERLSDTLAWAAAAELKALRNAVRSAGLSALRAIGSGGSLTAAYAVAAFHEQFASRMACVVTPLEASEATLDGAVSHWLLSAGGSNVDILVAARSLIAQEPRQLAVLCGRVESPLAELCRAHPYVDLLLYPPPPGKDGFLATNSLFGFAALVARAYASEFGGELAWAAAEKALSAMLAPGSEAIGVWRAATEVLWSRPTTLVLHGPATRVGAIDLESKFTEAALGNVQLADYRNFAHGRHHWLAKRADVSGILALITDEDRVLAERTLDLIPGDIPQARLVFAGERTTTTLVSLLAALRITEWAGSARGIDPGRPGVPEFGRQLYNLRLPLPKPRRVAGLSPRDAAAIGRKAGVPATILDGRGELDRWRRALADFRVRLWDARFRGVVLDYDGTVVETRDRFEPPAEAMTAGLVRVLHAGAWVGIATGRGVSVRKDLRAVLPPALWSRVLVGYYNGADIAFLDDDGSPDGSEGVCDELAPLARALRENPELADGASQTDRHWQITLESRRVMPEGRLWHLAQQVIQMGHHPVSVTRSSHSVDIVAAGVSKLKVAERLLALDGDGPLLSIGDRGRWPGNDYELLREPWALGVDEVSVDPATCWNLAPPGQRGAAVTLEYLAALLPNGGGFRLDPDALR